MPFRMPAGLYATIAARCRAVTNESSQEGAARVAHNFTFHVATYHELRKNMIRSELSPPTLMGG
jgi:hypothetical protein